MPTSASATTRSTPEGTVTLRHDSKLHHIGLGRAHKGKPIKLLVADRDIRVLDARTGELIRRLTLDLSRDYQPLGGAELSTMSRDICLRCRSTSPYRGDRI